MPATESVPAQRSFVRRRTTRVIVGLDFGTSSTKLVVRGWNEPAEVFVIDDPAADYPAFAHPSLIRVDGDRISYGSAALAQHGGTLFERLKVAFLGQRVDGATGQLAPHDVDLLVAAFLAWCLARVRARLDAKYGLTQDPGGYAPLLHVGAPMTHEGNPALVSRYDRVLHACYQIVFEGDPPAEALLASWSRLAAVLAPLLAADRVLPAPGERMFRVSPETLAPFVSLLQQRDAGLGLYVLVDVGAFTTEVLVVSLKRAGEDGRRFVTYIDATEFLGGENFPRRSGVHAAAVNEAEARQRLSRHLRITLATAFAKDRAGRYQREKWKSLQVLMSGGGILHPAVHEVITGRSWLDAALPGMAPQVAVRRQAPAEEDLRPDATHRSAVARRDRFHMLANAHGLSVAWQQWPGWFAPDDVEPLKNESTPSRPITDWEDG